MDEGARQAIEICLRVKPEDRVIIVTDVQTMDTAAALLDRAKRITTNIKFYILEDFGTRPIQEMPEAISEALNDSTISILALQSKGNELETFRMPYIKIIEKKQLKHAHMIGLTPEIMSQGMSADYEQIRMFSKKVYDLLQGVKKAKVTTAKGTKLDFEFDTDINWIISDGLITRKSWSNLPDGEVWTTPGNCNGTVVVDGVLGDFFSQKYGLLERTPIIVEIKNSRVSKVISDSQDLKSDFEEYIKRDENANRIGEFAVGTNLALSSLIGNMLQDEKFPGVHMAFGHSYPERTNSRWGSVVHCDAVIQKPTVVLDGKKLMEFGRYLI